MPTPKIKTGPTPIQTFITNVLKDKVMTPYELAIACGWPPTRVYRRLKMPTHHRHIEQMLAVLDVRLVCGDISVRLGMRDRKVIVRRK